MSVTPPVAHVEIWPYVVSADALSESHAATAVLMLLSVMAYPSVRRVVSVAADVFADPKGRAAAAKCGEASSAPSTRTRPAELPEPDKTAPTPVTAAAALRGDDHQPLSAPVLRVAAIAASKAREAAPAVQGQRCCIVLVREQDAKRRHSRAVVAARPQCQTRSGQAIRVRPRRA